MERGHPCPPEREARTPGEQRHDAAERAAHVGGQGCPGSISADDKRRPPFRAFSACAFWAFLWLNQIIHELPVDY